MKVIYKYPLNAYPTQHYLPKGAVFLSVQAQHDTPVMWFIVDADSTEKEQRNFIARPTGEQWVEGGNDEYLGTFQLRGGRLVFHVFELL